MKSHFGRLVDHGMGRSGKDRRKWQMLSTKGRERDESAKTNDDIEDTDVCEISDHKLPQHTCVPRTKHENTVVYHTVL